MDLDDQPALASARASGGGGATPRVAQQRPASAPPPLSATPVGGDEWAAVSVLDQNELLELLLAKGVQVPSSVLGVVCSRIEALSSVKAPAVLRQKRVYMQDWVHRQHAQAAALGVPLGLGEYPTPRPPTAGPAAMTPHSSLRSSGVGVGGGADGLSEHELQLAARVGTMVTPSGRLSIPSAEVPTLTAEVVAALGHSRHPISGSVSARRRFIEDWFDGLQPRLQGMQPPRGAAGADPLSPAPLPAFSPTSSAGGTPARHPAAAAAAEAAAAAKAAARVAAAAEAAAAHPGRPAAAGAVRILAAVAARALPPLEVAALGARVGRLRDRRRHRGGLRVEHAVAVGGAHHRRHVELLVRARAEARHLRELPRDRRPRLEHNVGESARVLGVLAAAVHEGVRDALGAGAAGAADAVDVVLDVAGEVEVDHRLDVLDVDAARGDVGRDHHGAAPRAEVGEHRLALALVLVAVDDAAAHLAHQQLAELVAHPLRRREDERARAHLERAEDLHQHLWRGESRVRDGFGA